jgi:uncharacterized damage-inducible protein DinB
MAEPSSVLDTVYQGWREHTRQLTQALAPLSAEQLALRAVPQQRSIGELAEHIIGGRFHWMQGMLGESNDELAAFAAEVEPIETMSADQLVRGLNLTRSLIDDRIAHWSAADLTQTITVTRNGRERSFTRQWVIWHLIEHDLHHGGELSFSLGIHHLATFEF